MTTYTFEIMQDGLSVVQGSGDDLEQVHRDAMHYAMVYGQDGPFEWRWKADDIGMDELAERLRQILGPDRATIVSAENK